MLIRLKTSCVKALTSNRLFPTALLALALPHALLGYSDCRFKADAYEAVCKKAVARGVSIDYANRYLLAPQTTERDARSLKLFQPKMISVHHANEKRANNALVAFVPEIAANLHRYSRTYDEAEKRFGVNREVIAAILAKETRLGRIPLKHDAFVVFNTLLRELAPDSKRNRALIAMAENNMVALMRFCYTNGIAPQQCRFSSSYAGAVGIPQFMPQNFGYVESAGKRAGNLDSMRDAILSTARLLHDSARYTVLIDWSKMPDVPRVEQAWYDFDFANPHASFAYEKDRYGKPYRCYACAKPSLSYMASYVKKIMRYNNSSNYAVGVLRLAYDAHYYR